MKQLIVVETIHAKPGKGDKLKDALLKMVPLSLQEPGCLHYEIAEPDSREEIFLVLMRWESLDDFKAHCTAAHINEFIEKYNNVLYGAFQENLWWSISE